MVSVRGAVVVVAVTAAHPAMVLAETPDACFDWSRTTAARADCEPCPDPDDICYEGLCVFRCFGADFPCPYGFYCKDLPDDACSPPPCRYCVPDPCVDITCETGFICDYETGECVDLCDSVVCPPGETCRDGLCFDCFDSACPGWDYCCAANQNCLVGAGGVGECVDNPCYDATCDSGYYCSDGLCLCLACDPPCGQNQTCEPVTCTCEYNCCVEIDCSSYLVCNPETCECQGDWCVGVDCPQGQACDPGTGGCINDPCLATTCPEGYACEVAFGGEATCASTSVDDGDNIYAAGGGGCGSVSSSPKGGHIVVLLAGLGLLFWPRRRRRSRV